MEENKMTKGLNSLKNKIIAKVAERGSKIKEQLSEEKECFIQAIDELILGEEIDDPVLEETSESVLEETNQY